MPERASLSGVTLACVDTRYPDLAWRAMQRCLSLADVADALFFAPHGWAPAATDARVHVHPTPSLTGIEDYNRFMLRDLAAHIQTSHTLIVQWDGFIVNPAMWQSTFLEWDYIGAPWYRDGSYSDVGNGGFSLRSQRLLSALKTLSPSSTEPEDRTICVTLRPTLEADFGIRFAPLEVAQRFSCEYGPFRPAFGFHGMHNFAHAMSPTELHQWLEAAPIELLCSKHARNLVKRLMHAGRSDEALGLITRRSSYLGWNRDQLALVVRAWWARACTLTR